MTEELKIGDKVSWVAVNGVVKGVVEMMDDLVVVRTERGSVFPIRDLLGSKSFQKISD